MGPWLRRLRTAAAAVAAAYLLWTLPGALKLLARTAESPGSPAAPVCHVRVWVCEDWTGGGLAWLSEQAAAFERGNRGARLVIRRVQAGEWLLPGVVPPDLLLFEPGKISNPEGLLAPLTYGYEVRDFLKSAGAWRGVAYAAPVCYGGYVRLESGENPDGPELVMVTGKEYDQFVARGAGSLVATVREARKLAALRAAGKGFDFLAKPHGEWTDRILLAGLFPGEGERAAYAAAFLAFLLSPAAQDGLISRGLLPASPLAAPPEAERDPLLFALWEAARYAANAFD